MSGFRELIFGLATLGLVGCAPQLLEYDATAPAAVLAPIGVPGVEDARSQFRQIFCAQLREAGVAAEDGCSRYLHHLRDEAGPPLVSPAIALHPGSIRILLVPGALGECVGESGIPFRSGAERLRELGYWVETVDLKGRSGTDHNAALIAEELSKVPPDAATPLVLIGYSKGVNDALTFLLRYPDLAQRVDALVGVAGSVNGSPLADRYARLYSVFADLSVPGCPAGDGQIVASLTRPLNLRGLAENPLPGHVRYFSLGAYTDSPHTARALRMLFSSDLARMDPRNDGQTLYYDQVMPGSVLLGYLNGDHWDVVIPLRERMPFFAGNSAGSPDFPRAELLESIVLFLEQYWLTRSPADSIPARPPAEAAPAGREETGQAIEPRQIPPNPELRQMIANLCPARSASPISPDHQRKKTQQ